MRKLSLILLLFAFTGVQAQNIVKSLEADAPGQGKVTIHQDPALESQMNSYSGLGDANKTIKAQGFRIQVYAGSHPPGKARDEAYGVAGRVKTYFPDLKVYTFFNSPRWLCQVGDFRSVEEADATMRKLKSTGVFKEVSIVKEQIIIPL